MGVGCLGLFRHVGRGSQVFSAQLSREFSYNYVRTCEGDSLKLNNYGLKLDRLRGELDDLRLELDQVQKFFCVHNSPLRGTFRYVGKGLASLQSPPSS